MSAKENMQLMASYNHWMNQTIYRAAGELNDVDLTENKGAFFGSVLGTLNHNLVADIIWLKRFSECFGSLDSLEYVRTLEKPTALNVLLFKDLISLQERRFELDNVIIAMVDEITDEMLAMALGYKNTKGIEHLQRFEFVLQHFFNHQTHHRGQLTTLFSQMNIEVGVTDLITTIPNM